MVPNWGTYGALPPIHQGLNHANQRQKVSKFMEFTILLLETYRTIGHAPAIADPLVFPHVLVYPEASRYHWLVVSTPLKNISQLGWWFPIHGKIKKCSKPPTRPGSNGMIASPCLAWTHLFRPRERLPLFRRRRDRLLLVRFLDLWGSQQMSDVEVS